MGNDTSIFRKCHISSTPYYTTSKWSLHRAQLNSKKLTVIMLAEPDDGFDISQWKSIRHPLIVQYYDSGLLRGRRCVVTEHIEPLRPLLDKLTREQIVAGLHDLLIALSFLQQNNYSHNNVSIDSIFVSRKDNFSWKLAGLEFLSKLGQETDDQLTRLLNYKQTYEETNLLAPEDFANNKFKLITAKKDLHRRDVYAFGLIAGELLGDDVPPMFTNCQSKDANTRPQFEKLLNESLFKSCDYLRIKNSLTSFASMTEEAKEQFIENLITILREIDETLLASAVIPLIMTSRIFMLHPLVKEKIIPHLFVYECGTHPKVSEPLVSADNFETHLIPVILKLYMVKNLRLRLILLENLPCYVKLIDKDEATVHLLPAIQLGLKDTSDQLVLATYKALAVLVENFGGSLIVGEERSKLFHNDLPRLHPISCVNYDVHMSKVPDKAREEPDGSELEKSQSFNDLSLNDPIASDPPERFTPSEVDLDDSQSQYSQSIEEEILIANPENNVPIKLESKVTKSMKLTGKGKNVAPNKKHDLNDLENELRQQAKQEETTLDLSELKLSNSKKESSKLLKPKPKPNSDFDVKSIVIERKTTELDDLFAQIEPEVKFSEKQIIKKKKPVRRSSNESASSSASNQVSQAVVDSNKFDLKQHTDEAIEGDAWNDEELNVNLEE